MSAMMMYASMGGQMISCEYLRVEWRRRGTLLQRHPDYTRSILETGSDILSGRFLYWEARRSSSLAAKGKPISWTDVEREGKGYFTGITGWRPCNQLLRRDNLWLSYRVVYGYDCRAYFNMQL